MNDENIGRNTAFINIGKMFVNAGYVSKRDRIFSDIYYITKNKFRNLIVR